MVCQDWRMDILDYKLYIIIVDILINKMEFFLHNSIITFKVITSQHL